MSRATVEHFGCKDWTTRVAVAVPAKLSINSNSWDISRFTHPQENAVNKETN